MENTCIYIYMYTMSCIYMWEYTAEETEPAELPWYVTGSKPPAGNLEVFILYIYIQSLIHSPLNSLHVHLGILLYICCITENLRLVHYIHHANFSTPLYYIIVGCMHTCIPLS